MVDFCWAINTKEEIASDFGIISCGDDFVQLVGSGGVVVGEEILGSFDKAEEIIIFLIESDIAS